jgi:hypothetical protein
VVEDGAASVVEDGIVSVVEDGAASAEEDRAALGAARTERARKRGPKIFEACILI